MYVSLIHFDLPYTFLLLNIDFFFFAFLLISVDNKLANASAYGPHWFPKWVNVYKESRNITIKGLSDNLTQLFAELADTYGKTYGVKYRNFTVKYDRFVRKCLYAREPCSMR